MKRLNRKRMVAIVVGVLVVLLLALFPPYVPPDSADIAWTDAEPPVVALRWIGSAPPQRLGYVTEQETVPFDVNARSWQHVRDADGRWERRPMPPQYEKKVVTKRTCIGVPFRISTITLVLSISIAVALTAASVLLLKDRKLRA